MIFNMLNSTSSEDRTHLSGNGSKDPSYLLICLTQYGIKSTTEEYKSRNIVLRPLFKMELSLKIGIQTSGIYGLEH